MPVQLLPASAAAFAPRASSVNVVLGSKVEPWLTQTLKRINRVKRPLNSVPQHQRCLTETLSSPNAIWTLTSIMLPKTPEADFKRDAGNPLVEAIMNYELVHLEAYIVHVDMVLRNEVAYKLTKDTIETLVEYHKEVYCVDAKANTYDWSDKEQQCKKLHEDFVQAINKFVFRTHVSALEGLEEEGAGELLCGKSEEVKNNIFALMKPLLPPPPRVVDVVRQPTLLPSSPANNMWSQAGMPGSLPAVESWRVLPSSPSVTSSVDSNTSPIWAPMTMSDLSPTPAFTQPQSTAGFFWSSPQVTAPIPAPPPPQHACSCTMRCQRQHGRNGRYGQHERHGWHGRLQLGSIPGVRYHHVTTRAPGQLSSGDDLELIQHAPASPSSFPGEKLKLSISQRHRTIIHHGHTGVLLHQERCFEQVNKYPLFALLNLLSLVLLFYYFLCPHSKRSFLVSGNLVSIPLRETHSNGRSQQTTQPTSQFPTLGFLSSTTPQMAGSGAGIWNAFTTGQGFDTGGLFSFGLFPSVIYLLVRNKKKTNTQQCTTLGQVRDRNFWILDIPGTFFLFLFHSFGIERLSRKIPLPPYKEHDWIARIQPKHKHSHNKHSRFASFLGLFPNYDDDNFLMTTFSTNR